MCGSGRNRQLQPGELNTGLQHRQHGLIVAIHILRKGRQKHGIFLTVGDIINGVPPTLFPFKKQKQTPGSHVFSAASAFCKQARQESNISDSKVTHATSNDRRSQAKCVFLSEMSQQLLDLSHNLSTRKTNDISMSLSGILCSVLINKC